MSETEEHVGAAGSQHSHHATPEQEEDGTRIGPPLAVAAAALVIFAIGTFWGAEIQLRTAGTIGAAGGPAPAASQAEIGIVDQVPFEADARLEERRRRERARLEGWSWEDRAHGVVRMPIERAMEQVVRSSAR
jgi:hypothetical protein